MSLTIVIISALKTLTANSNIGPSQVWALLIVLSLEISPLCMSSNFGLYPGHCEYYAVETLNNVIPPKSIYFVIVLLSN